MTSIHRKAAPNESPTRGNQDWPSQECQQIFFALFSILGNWLRRSCMGKRQMSWYTASGPDAYELSQVFQLWAENLGHVGATCESGGSSPAECREYSLEIGFGHKNPTLSVSVVATPDTASIIVLCEGRKRILSVDLVPGKVCSNHHSTGERGMGS